MKSNRSASPFKRVLVSLGCFAVVFMAAQVNAVSTGLAISQIYGGGGNLSATYLNGFVELFNRGSSAVSLAGLTVQYASAAGSFTAANVTTLDAAVSLQPGQYYLIQLGSGGATGVAFPVTADQTNTLVNISATAGKIALVNGTIALGTVTSLPDNRIIDFLGYGSTASLFEGSNFAPAPSVSTADFRRSSGCTDTDDNRADFTTASPSPRNTTSSLNICGVPAPDGPRISAIVSGSSLQVIWPTNNNDGFVLETTGVINSTNWSAVNGVTTSGTNYTDTIPFGPSSAYFRLKK